MLNDEIKKIYIKKDKKKDQSQPRLTLKLAILIIRSGVTS
jgi:hypothetical protein